jgi:hypothetical protein
LRMAMTFDDFALPAKQRAARQSTFIVD